MTAAQHAVPCGGQGALDIHLLLASAKSNRYLDFMEVHLKETCQYELKQDLKNELAAAILNLDVSI